MRARSELFGPLALISRGPGSVMRARSELFGPLALISRGPGSVMRARSIYSGRFATSVSRSLRSLV